MGSNLGPPPVNQTIIGNNNVQIGGTLSGEGKMEEFLGVLTPEEMEARRVERAKADYLDNLQIVSRQITRALVDGESRAAINLGYPSAAARAHLAELFRKAGWELAWHRPWYSETWRVTVTPLAMTGTLSLVEDTIGDLSLADVELEEGPAPEQPLQRYAGYALPIAIAGLVISLFSLMMNLYLLFRG